MRIKAEDETNTKYAQGGLAVVMDLDTDNFQKETYRRYHACWRLRKQ